MYIVSLQIIPSGVKFNINENLDINISHLTERMKELLDTFEKNKLYYHHKGNNITYVTKSSSKVFN